MLQIAIENAGFFLLVAIYVAPLRISYTDRPSALADSGPVTIHRASS